MHLATYSNSDAGRMLAHYERSIGERDHIDRDLPVYNLAPDYEGGSLGRYRELTEGLVIGSKTKPLADLVVTMPKGFDGSSAVAFFDAAYGFLRDRVGTGASCPPTSIWTSLGRARTCTSPSCPWSRRR